MFFFKKTKVVLDCFTYDPIIAKTAPLLPALKFYPQWLRKIPSERIEERRLPDSNEVHSLPSGTLKGCPGVIDYFKTGVMAPLWTDASIAIHPDGRYTFASADNPFKLESHWPGQWDGFHGYQHIKIVFPWHIEESTGVKFLLQKPMWTSNDNPVLINKFVSAGGVIDFKSQHCLHLHVFAELPQIRQEFILELGTPLIHLIPLTEKEIDIRNHIIDEAEWIKRTQTSTGAKTFMKQSLKRDLMIKSVEEGCPFK
jgi:hypothetical protein